MALGWTQVPATSVSWNVLETEERTYVELLLGLLLVVGVVVDTLSAGGTSGLGIRLGVWGWRLAALVGRRHCVWVYGVEVLIEVVIFVG